MTLRYCIVIVMGVFTFFLCSSAVNAEIQSGFNEEELQEFCQELPIVLASMNNEEKDKFFINVIKDYPHTVLPESITHDSRLSLQPQRITYILNHIILAGVIEDLGGFGEGQLDLLKKERERIKNNPKIPPAEREKILAEMQDGITNLNDLVVQTKLIPISELALIWKDKDMLNALLRGKIPIHKKQMARQYLDR